MWWPRVRKLLASPWLRAAISIGLIVAVLVSMDSAELREDLARISIWTVAVLLAIDLGLRLMSAYRWHILYRMTNLSVGLNEITRITFVSSFLGQVLPGIIGVEALRTVSLARAKSDWPGALASVVVDRALGLVSLVLVVLLGIVFGPAGLGPVLLAPTLIALALVVTFIVCAFVPHLRGGLRMLIPRTFEPRVRPMLDQLYTYLDLYSTSPWQMTYALFVAIAFQFGRILLFYVAALMIGEHAELKYFVTIVPSVMFISLLPISISGIGVREASLVLLFSQFNVMGSASAFTVGLLALISGTLSTLPGGWFYIRRRRDVQEAIDQASEVG